MKFESFDWNFDRVRLSCVMLTLALISLLVIKDARGSRLDRETSIRRVYGNEDSEIEPSDSKALINHLLRFKRQQSGDIGSSSPSSSSSSATSPSSSSASSPSSATSTSSSSPGDGSAGASLDARNNLVDDRSDDEQQVTVNRLRCDFGSADAPDLCGFRAIENPLVKTSASWSHGSGRLALYQGGPLTDAGEKNDTLGGYIFYETSSLMMMMMMMSTNSSQRDIPANDYSSGANRQSRGNLRATSAASDHHEHHQHLQHQRQHQHQNLHPHAMDSAQPLQVRISVAAPAAAASPSFASPNLTATGPSGMCLSFHYAIQGLSAEELRIQVSDLKTGRSRLIWSSSESAGGNWTRGEVLYSAPNKHSLVFSASGSPMGWAARESQHRKFRGYIAMDEIEVDKHDPSGGDDACKGHCNFDGDLCGWTNAENGLDDDFDWSFGRGSDNLFTGPARDYLSSTNNELTGSYLRVGAGYPRRPGDRAVLVSPMFQATEANEALCLRFAVHMFGSGVGSLAVKIRYSDGLASLLAAQAAANATGGAQASGPTTAAAGGERGDAQDVTVWELAGDAGNVWHQAQTSVSSSRSPFQVIVEGVVGENHLGDIAIDEVSFSRGPCPTSPPAASKNFGDCTFEQSTCHWGNPGVSMRLDDLDWVRAADEQSIHGPNADHTLKRRSGSYLRLENTFKEPKSGARAFLLSPVFEPKPHVSCLSFYYYMFMRSVGQSGPNLGTIRVYLASNNELNPIWRLTNPISSPNWKHARVSLATSQSPDGQPLAPTRNFQLAFEGIWGDAPGGAIAIDDITVFDGACDLWPPEAKSVVGECTFDVDMCSWRNRSAADASAADSSAVGSRSPFLQSVGGGAQHGATATATAVAASRRPTSWQLATVDSRPVNLQDHTYRAPIGYVYVDVLEPNAPRTQFYLQSAETAIPNTAAATQVTQCLSFWFVAFGRQEDNALAVHLTQASSPPPDSPATTGGRQSSAGGSSSSSSGGSLSPGATAGGATGVSSPASPTSGTNNNSRGESNGETEDNYATAWKHVDGKLVWSIALRNITEANRRRWTYGQVSLKLDSNHIVRFVASSSDGGFALDDVSYYDGACETRPSAARVSDDDQRP